MKIVILDGFALNPGDLTWTDYEDVGKVMVYDRTSMDEIVERAEGAEIVLTNKTPLDAATLAKLPDLRYIGVLATGYNVVDTQVAKQQGITVTNIPGYSSASVAQLTFALLLELCHRVQQHSDAVYAGEWVNSLDFSFTKSPLIELVGKRMGLIGFGQIGKQTAAIAAAFGMEVLTLTRHQRGEKFPFPVRYVEQQELFTEADVISLHCPLTEETQGMINQDTISFMKRSAILLNTSRGGLIQEQHLADALHDGRIAGAGLDVLSTEPPDASNPLLSAPNCVITPHIAWATREARQRLNGIAAQNIRSFLSGNPENTV